MDGLTIGKLPKHRCRLGFAGPAAGNPHHERVQLILWVGEPNAVEVEGGRKRILGIDAHPRNDDVPARR